MPSPCAHLPQTPVCHQPTNLPIDASKVVTDAGFPALNAFAAPAFTAKALENFMAKEFTVTGFSSEYINKLDMVRCGSVVWCGTCCLVCGSCACVWGVLWHDIGPLGAPSPSRSNEFLCGSDACSPDGLSICLVWLKMQRSQKRRLFLFGHRRVFLPKIA